MWIDHNGSGAPESIPEGQEVRVRYRDGVEGVATVIRYEYGDSAKYDDWTHDGSDFDIVAYHVEA